MSVHEHRRVVNQPQTATAAEWEQLRRALLMVVAQFKESNPQSGYTLDIRVVPRATVQASH